MGELYSAFHMMIYDY